MPDNLLIEFLLARFAEDEDAARRTAFGYGAEWTSESDDAEDWSVVHADGKRDMVGCEDGDVTRHIARHDPARVLAECEAKRLIVELSRRWIGGAQGYQEGVREGVRASLRLLALPHADHPDYREEWRP